MVDNKEIDAYMSIKAPESIKERLMDEQAKKHSIIPTKIHVRYALAAMLLLIAAVFAFLPDVNTELYYGDTPLNENAVIVKTANSQNARIALLSLRDTEEIPLSIKTDKKTEISVSHGSILLLTENGTENVGHSITVDCDTSFFWSVDTTSVDSGCTITVGKASYSISENNKSQWVLSKK